MKKYFAKYLPVEGEVKEGSTFLDSELGICILLKGGWVEWKGGKTTLVVDDSHKLCKLFLCSRDIQVGDEVQNGDGELCRVPNEADLRNAKDHGFFTMLGEISPEANWVKEGDEFGEDEVKEIWWHPIGNCETIPPRNPNQTHKVKRFLILGPCKHFH